MSAERFTVAGEVATDNGDGLVWPVDIFFLLGREFEMHAIYSSVHSPLYLLVL